MRAIGKFTNCLDSIVGDDTTGLSFRLEDDLLSFMHNLVFV